MANTLWTTGRGFLSDLKRRASRAGKCAIFTNRDDNAAVGSRVFASQSDYNLI